MNQDKLRKLAGMPLVEAKKKEPDVDTAPDSAPPAKGADELPAIIEKIAANLAKKFGIGSPDGEDSEDLNAVKDFLMKVYAAGLADAEKTPVTDDE